MRKDIPLSPATRLEIDSATGWLYLDQVPLGKATQLWRDHADREFVPNPEGFVFPYPAPFDDPRANQVDESDLG